MIWPKTEHTAFLREGMTDKRTKWLNKSSQIAKVKNVWINKRMPKIEGILPVLWGLKEGRANRKIFHNEMHLTHQWGITEMNPFLWKFFLSIVCTHTTLFTTPLFCSALFFTIVNRPWVFCFLCIDSCRWKYGNTWDELWKFNSEWICLWYICTSYCVAPILCRSVILLLYLQRSRLCFCVV